MLFEAPLALFAEQFLLLSLSMMISPEDQRSN
jgi:hypothetical protein